MKHKVELILKTPETLAVFPCEQARRYRRGLFLFRTNICRVKKEMATLRSHRALYEPKPKIQAFLIGRFTPHSLVHAQQSPAHARTHTNKTPPPPPPPETTHRRRCLPSQCTPEFSK